MQAIDCAILVLLAVLAAAALLHLVRRHRRTPESGCIHCAGCTRCAGRCCGTDVEKRG
ncbi:MAG: hypothetical protein SOR38_07840 [Oscillospiraceae bacterium]|nr:hypothetical protein [Oscillospiraceae bacterium]MDY3065704.1 hypothetical protein [Oscillospiraceae bacterium]